MAVSKSSKSAAVEPLAPTTRLTLTFRELVINGKKDWRHAWVFAQFAADSGDSDMVKVMECYKALKKKEQATVSPEYVCDLAGVDSNDFAAEVFREYLSYSGDAANLIEAASRPAVVKKQVAVALTTDGWRDRKMLHEHSGFLPQKTGGGIHVNASANADAKSAAILPNELPSMESDTRRFTRTLKDSEPLTIDVPPEQSPARVPALGA